MVIDYMLYFNPLIFLGMGFEIIIGRNLLNFSDYASVCAANSFSLALTSPLVFLAAGAFAVAPDCAIFSMALIFSFFLNESVLRILKFDGRGILYSLNIIGCAFPCWILKNAKTPQACFKMAFGAAAGFFIASMIFYFIKKSIYSEADEHDEYGIFCYELAAAGFLSVSFSLFFRMV